MPSESHSRWESLPFVLQRAACFDDRVRTWVRAYKADMLGRDELFCLINNHFTYERIAPTSI